MKKKTFCILLTTVLLSLTACGETVTESQESQNVESVPESSQGAEQSKEAPVQTILEYRDQLELEQITQFTSERQDELASIIVDVKDENSLIQTQAKSVYDFMKQGLSAEVLAMLASEDWNSIMFPALVIGQRNYFYQLTDAENVRIMVAADEVGNELSAVLYSGEDGAFFYLEKNSDLVKSVRYSQGSGEFTSEIMRLDDGYYIRYDGSIDAESYVLTGELKVGLGTLPTEEGFLAAWNNREANLTEYVGEFNETGRTKIVTPGSLANDGMLAYATHAQRRGADYLSIKTDTAADEYSFFGDFAGLFTVWGRLQ